MMDKFKKIYRDNRIFVILMIIVAICVVFIAVGLFKLFFGNGADKYGDRLDGIKTVEISDSKISSAKNMIEEEESVISTSITVTGRVIYVSINFNDTVTLEDAKLKAAKSLENFTDEEQAFYDLNYTIKQTSTETTDGFLVMGAKNANGTKFEWNNNRVIEEESE